MIYRPDIDGLRALSILLILIYHVNNAVIPGGFVGVDVFFVISGYLITSIVWKDLLAGRFSFVDFYARRIRRIFPPVLVVLAVCLVVGWNSLFAHEFKVLGKHIAASAAFVSNWVYQSEAGYFDLSSVDKPLLHLWSLAIEEQFYVVWPLVLWIVVRGPFACFRLMQRPLLYTVVCVAGASLLLCWILTWLKPEVVFYSLSTRAWELGAGALLVAIPLRITSEAVRNGLAWMGGGLIAVAAMLLDHSMLYPGWAALLPVFGAIALVVSGPSTWVHLNVLSARPVVMLGKWSFSIYLWHWPLLYFMRTLGWSRLYPELIWVVIPASVGLAALTYTLIETPIKRWPLRRIAVSLLAAMVMVGYVGFNVYSRNGLDFRERLRIEGFGGVSEESTPGCLAQFVDYRPTFCRMQNDARQADVLLLGDSMGHNAFIGIAEAYAKKGGNLAMLGWPGQPPLLDSSNQVVRESSDWQRLLSAVAANPKWRTILLTFRLRYTEQIDVARLDATLAYLQQSGKEVIFLMEPPMLPFSPIACVGMPPFRFQTNETCSITENELPESYYSDRTDVMKVLKIHQVPYFDAHRVVCAEENCKFLLDGQVMYRTVKYLTEKGAIFVYQDFLGKLQRD